MISATLPPCVTVHPGSPESIGGVWSARGVAIQPTAASAAWPLANLALFVPFLVRSPLTAVKLFCYNGVTTSGNVDIGIYSVDGVRLVSSGSTAQSGTNVLQVFDVADTLIGSGLFYMACAFDNTTATVFRMNVGTTTNRLSGVFEQTSAFPLPASATFALTSRGIVPVFGLTTRNVV